MSCETRIFIEIDTKPINHSYISLRIKKKLGPTVSLCALKTVPVTFSRETLESGACNQIAKYWLLHLVNIWEETPTLVSSKVVNIHESRWNPSIHNLERTEQILHISAGQEK